jgi:hypothetical protein
VYRLQRKNQAKVKYTIRNLSIFFFYFPNQISSLGLNKMFLPFSFKTEVNRLQFFCTNFFRLTYMMHKKYSKSKVIMITAYCLLVILRQHLRKLLKGTVSRDFLLQVFSWIIFPSPFNSDKLSLEKIRNGRNGILRCLGETDSWKKNRSRKSRDSIPLIHFSWKFNEEMLNYIFMRTFHIASRVKTFPKYLIPQKRRNVYLRNILLFVPKLVCLVSLTQQNICQVAKQTNDNINFPNQMFAIYQPAFSGRYYATSN